MVKDQETSTEAARHALIFNITNEVLNSISMASALLVICAISYLRVKHKNISNRVSLRLQTYVSITDMFFAAFQIMTVNSVPPGNWVCHVAPWGFVFTALLGCFFTVTIAFNLQVIFIHNYINTKRFEKYYIVVPIGLSLLLSTVPVAFNALGFDEKEVSCWYKNGSTIGAVIWQWTTLHGWIILSVLYCIYTVFRIILRLNKTNKEFKSVDRSSPNSPNFNRPLEYKRQLMINRAVKRIVLYPVVPIITFTFNIIVTIIFFITKHNIFAFQMLSNVGTSSQGLLNAFVFCFDPAMRKVWNEVFMKKKVDNDIIDLNNNNNNNNVKTQNVIVTEKIDSNNGTNETQISDSNTIVVNVLTTVEHEHTNQFDTDTNTIYCDPDEEERDEIMTLL